VRLARDLLELDGDLLARLQRCRSKMKRTSRALGGVRAQRGGKRGMRIAARCRVRAVVGR
jgi:hypothetical protein